MDRPVLVVVVESVADESLLRVVAEGGKNYAFELGEEAVWLRC